MLLLEDLPALYGELEQHYGTLACSDAEAYKSVNATQIWRQMQA